MINREKETEKENQQTYKKDTLSDKEIEEKIKTFGEALELVLSVSYEKENKTLTYEEAVKLVHNSSDISCDIHEIYEDRKVYLNECSYAGKKTKYSYGEKQEIKQIDNTTTITVYVEKNSKTATLEKPSDVTKYDVYTVNVGEKYYSAELFTNTGFEYVLYYANDRYHMTNYVTGKEIFSELNPSDIKVFNKNSKRDTSYVALLINNKWAIYNINTSSMVGNTVYDNINDYSWGQINVINDLYIVVKNGDNYGIINYQTGSELLPVIYKELKLGENYLFVSDGNIYTVYDFNGEAYLTGEFEKIYNITKGNYIVGKKNNKIVFSNITGKILYDFGEVSNIKSYYYSTEYDGKLLAQFSKIERNDNQLDCIEFSYDFTTKKGEVIDSYCAGIAKPILYLYPEKETDVTVKFSNPEILETTYPKFNGKWEVKAKSNGDLYDKSGKYYYALYWDEKKVHSVDFSEGFYVDKDEAIDFLEKKLSYIGLNDKERNEFIMYWLPVLEKNGKNLVYFELTEERESYNKLLISPKPDSMLRLVIHIKKVDKKVDIPKQSLSKFKRVGFTVVEWGGTTY